MGLFVCNVANEYGETEKEMWGLKTENRGQQGWVLDTTCINSDVKWFSCVPINPSHANGIMPVLQLSQDKGEISSIALTFDLFQSKKTPNMPNMADSCWIKMLFAVGNDN